MFSRCFAVSTIVKHILPSSNDIVDLKNENVDKATADWLNQQYTSGNTGGVDAALGDVVLHGVESDAEIERRRIATESVFKIIGNPAVLDTWDFDVLTVGSNVECVEIVHYMFDTTFDFFHEFKIPHEVFDSFLNINSNTYHHFKHAVDVCHTCYRLMMTAELNTVATGGSGAMTSLEMMSLLIAALGHDVGHPAVNNGFLVKSKHALAFQHNDKSPLENMHCVVLYETLSKPENNIFVGLSDSQWRDARKVILFSILGTDMAHHFEQVKKTALFNDLNNESIANYYRGDAATIECITGNGKTEFENRLFVIELVLHCSDISNPFKPFDVCAKWADLVMAEFFSQGDQERALGFDISPGFDRNTTNIYNMQLGFIEFIVAPLISGEFDFVLA